MAEPRDLTPLDASGLRIGVAVAEYNEAITSGLLEGALTMLEAAGCSDIVVVRVPGSFELPLVVHRLAAQGLDAVVALGAVVKGDTDHYTHIAAQAAAGLMRAALDTGVPVGFGVLTVTDMAQAIERSKPGPGNKGAEAADSAVRAARTLAALD